MAENIHQFALIVAAVAAVVVRANKSTEQFWVR